jgi:dipeptidase D
MNAIQTVARLLRTVIDAKIEIELAEFSGGEQLNIIPRLANAVIAVPIAHQQRVCELISAAAATIFEEFRLTENPPVFTVNAKSAQRDVMVVGVDQTRRLASLILLFPNGPIRMSPVFPGTVDASVNLSTVRLEGDSFAVRACSRGVLQSKLDETEQKILTLCELSGLQFTTTIGVGGLPWAPNENSPFANLVQNSFEAVTGQRKPFGLIPATVEVGQFLALGYDVDAVGICPSVPKAHCVGEYVSIDEIIEWREVIFHVLPKVPR